MTRDEHTTNRPTPGGSAFQETGMDDYLTRVAEAVRAACFEACNENGGDMGAICTVDLPAIIASVPRPETVAWIIDWPDEPELGHYLAENPSRYGRSRGLYVKPVAAQPAVPEQWQAVAWECVSHLDDGRTQPAVSRSLRKLSALLAATPEAPQVDSQAMQADELQENAYRDHDEIAGLRARIAELEADKRTLRIDAERYRWIRDKERFHIDGECGDATFSSCMCCAEEFDAAIDDAMTQPAE